MSRGKMLFGSVLMGCIAVAVMSGPAAADVEVILEEGSPNDYVTIWNRDACDLGPVSITIDLTASAGGLYFDTTERGAGLSAYQPFKLYVGGDKVRRVTPVEDGGRSVTLSLTHLGPGEAVGFTVDMDDSAADGSSLPTVIDGSEVLGAIVALQFDPIGGGTASTPTMARFGGDGRALISASACLS